jgi:hypothetical protein
MKLVLIEWLDSASGSGWRSLDTIKSQPGALFCSSVGWVVDEAEEYVSLVSHLAREPKQDTPHQGCGDMTIPRPAIQRVVDLTTESPNRS